MPLNEGSPPAVRSVAARTFGLERGGSHPADWVIPVETGVSLVYSGIPFAVMMVTPSDLEDFGIGFSLTEGIIEDTSDIRAIAIDETEEGLSLQIDLAPERLRKHLGRRRAITGRTSCGVCGVTNLAALRHAGHRLSAPNVRLSAIRRALGELEGRQSLNRSVRAAHAAAWATLDGEITRLREDVGRHNALDKLIGALARQAVDPATGMVLITSRCSYEMVEKAAAFGAATVVAISAPTSLAIERARTLGMTLVALARPDAVTLFHGAERIIDDPAIEASAA
jgi:FdhD protein